MSDTNKFKTHLQNIAKYAKTKDAAAHTFEIGVIASKFTMLTALLALSYKNADTAFISKHPENFLSECIAIGASAMLPTLVFAINRRNTREGMKWLKTFNAMFVVFLVFFIFHMLMEMSGMNGVETKEINKDDEIQQKYLEENIFTKPKMITLCVGVIIMTCLALRVRDTSIGLVKGIGEFAFFGLINAAPYYLICKDRGMETKKALKGSALTGLMYSTLYVGLQLGGFFTHAFGKPESFEIHPFKKEK